MSDDSTEKAKQKYNFKCMEQKCTTKACHVRSNVNVTFGDLGRWTTQNYLQHILGGLTIKMLNEETGEMAIVTKRIPLKEGTDDSACIFYQEEANGCAIRFSRPISCRTYPLSYNGEKYFLSGKDCPGVGMGEATTEALKEASALAEQEFKERVETLGALPALYAVIMAPIIQQSAEAMQSLSEEDRKKMDEILSKSKPDKGEDSEPSNGQ